MQVTKQSLERDGHDVFGSYWWLRPSAQIVTTEGRMGKCLSVVQGVKNGERVDPMVGGHEYITLW